MPTQKEEYIKTQINSLPKIKNKDYTQAFENNYSSLNPKNSISEAYEIKNYSS